MKTLIGLVLDESSSMFVRKEEVINGFNKFIEDQKKITDDSARLFLVKFSSRVTDIHKGIPLEEVKPMTEKDYQPQGSTALYDAIAQCVKIMDEEKTADERAICVIMTDGEENCSQNTTISDIRSLIQKHEQQNDWTFLYIGVEIDQWIKTSGMRSTHCSKGFSNRLLPNVGDSKRSPRRLESAFWKRRPIQRTSLTDSLDLLMIDSVESVDSEEMTAMSSAISDFRRSAESTPDDPFASSRSTE